MQKVSDMSLRDWCKSVVRGLISGCFIGMYVGGITALLKLDFDFRAVERLNNGMVFSCVVLTIVVSLIGFLVAFLAAVFWSFSDDWEAN